MAWAILPYYSWRVLLAASTAPLALLLVLMCAVPESPFFAAAKGDVARAKKILTRISNTNRRPLPSGMLQTPTSVVTTSADDGSGRCCGCAGGGGGKGNNPCGG